MSKHYQKNLIFSLILGLNFVLWGQLQGQSCYVRLSDASGLEPTQSQLNELNSAACRLRDSLPSSFQNSFKVYDFEFYLHNETMVGGYPEMFQDAISKVDTPNQYFLFFGKQTDKTGIYTKFWVFLKMPTTAQFSCMTALQREVYKKRVEVKINEKYAECKNSFLRYHEAEVAGMQEFIKIISEIKVCCLANRNGIAEKSLGCGGCSDSTATSYFDLNKYETYQIPTQLSPPSNITKQWIIDKSTHKITINGETSTVADALDSLTLYLNTKFPLSLAITSNPSLCVTPPPDIESYLNQSGNGFKGWINFASSNDGFIPLKIKIYYKGLTSSKFTPQLNEILINYIKCEISQKIPMSGFECDDCNNLNLHYYLLATNPDYNELNSTFATAPPWLWPIIREIAIELILELLKRQGGKTVQLPINVLEALRAIGQGDLYEFLDEAKDILANTNYPLRIFDAIWDTGELGWKANKVVGKIRAMYGPLGEATINKVWNAINKNFDVLKNFDVSGDNKALKLIGKTVSEFWDDLKIEFGVSVTPSDGFNGVYFQTGDIYFVNYPASSSTGGPTIEIRICKVPSTCSGVPTATNSKDLYKFRF